MVGVSLFQLWSLAFFRVSLSFFYLWILSFAFLFFESLWILMSRISRVSLSLSDLIFIYFWFQADSTEDFEPLFDYSRFQPLNFVSLDGILSLLTLTLCLVAEKILGFLPGHWNSLYFSMLFRRIKLKQIEPWYLKFKFSVFKRVF